MSDEFLKSAEKRVSKASDDSEADIEDAFCKHAIKSGCKALKLVYLRRRGFPDRTVLCPNGRVLFIEFKRKNTHQTSTQFAVQQMLEYLGFNYYICREIGQAEQILQNFLKN